MYYSISPSLFIYIDTFAPLLDKYKFTERIFIYSVYRLSQFAQYRGMPLQPQTPRNFKFQLVICTCVRYSLHAYNVCSEHSLALGHFNEIPCIWYKMLSWIDLEHQFWWNTVRIIQAAYTSLSINIIYYYFFFFLSYCSITKVLNRGLYKARNYEMCICIRNISHRASTVWSNHIGTVPKRTYFIGLKLMKILFNKLRRKNYSCETRIRTRRSFHN